MFRWLSPLGRFTVALRVIALTLNQSRSCSTSRGALFRPFALHPSFGSQHHPFGAASRSCRALVLSITRERVTASVTRVEDRSEAKCQRLKRSSVPRWRGPRRRGCKSPLVLTTTVVCSIRLVPVVTTGCWKSLESLLALPLVFPRSPKRTASTAEPPRTRVFHRQFFEEIAYCRFFFVSAAIFCLSGCRRRGDLDGLGTIPGRGTPALPSSSHVYCFSWGR